MGAYWDLFRISLWPTLLIACVFAVAAAVRIATVHAECQIQVIEDGLNVKNPSATGSAGIVGAEQ